MRRVGLNAIVFVCIIALASSFAWLQRHARASAFMSGNLVIYRVGDGTAALASSGTSVFLDEYTTAGVLVQSLPVPTTTVGANRRLVASGTATSEGLLTRSADGQYLVLSGYDAALATASITTSTSATVNRVIGRVGSNGVIDTTTALTDAISGGNPRGATSTNGTDLWLSGTSSGGGIRYAMFGATSSTSLATTPTNIRATNIFGGQLYVSSQSGAFRLATVGTGTPTTSGQTITNLPGYPTATTSPYGFFFADLNVGVAGVDTLYVADDNSAGGTGGIQKYSLVAASWVANGSIASTAGLRGLTGVVSGNSVTLYTTSGSSLSTLTDTTGYNATITGTLTSLAPAGANTAFRGVAFTPVAAQPNLTINDVTMNEGNAGTTTFTFTVSLSAPAGPGGVTFDIATADGTAQDDNPAIEDNDYVAKTLTGQTIPAGSSTYTFDVQVNGDTNIESNETFFVNVTNVTGATATDAQGLGTINNDDSPNLSINDVTLSEGNAGTTTFTFTVSLSQPAGAGGVTFDIATADGTAQDDNPVAEDNDYVAKSLTGQTIPMGSSTYTFDVLVNGDTVLESNENFFVNVTSVTGASITDGQGVGTINNNDFTPIHDIQGAGASSPLSGSVTTRGIVTGLKSNGFFIQEPDATIDANPLTSEGIFVFTSGAPPVAAALGNLVQVTGTIAEFVPTQDPQQPPLTELTSPTVVQLSTGNPLPVPMIITATFPSPAGVFDQLERWEGMRVSMSSLTVGGPTLGNVNEPNATATSTGVFFGVFTGLTRAFREAGIQHPDVAPSGTIPPIPRWDTNPELIRVDSDGLTGGSIIDVGTGALVTGLVGPLDYGFRHYTILPDPASPPIVAGGPTATAVTTPLGDEITIASYNLERFFDTVNDPGIGEPVLTATAFNNRLAKASLGIRDFLKTPDIVGIVEIENLTTLQALAAKINADAVAAAQPNPNYTAFLVEGNDIGGIDVGFLVKTAIVTGAIPRVTVNSVTQELDASLFTNPNASTETLHDRPPLRLDATVNFASGATFPVQVIVNHMRSLNGVDDLTPGSNGWATDGERIRAKRLAQAVDLANFIQTRQTNNPNERIILVGDFNFFEFNDGYGDSMSTLLGAPVPDNQTVVPGDGVDLVTPDLTLLLDSLLQRYSFVFDGNAQTLDHAIVNSALIAGTSARRIEHPRINADFPEIARNGTATVERLADHDPLVVYLQLQPCMLTCPSNITVAATSGQCGAIVTYSAPTTSGDCGTVTCSPTSGSTFNVGTTTVTCMQSGGTPTCSFTVTVTDNQAPTVVCPANITTNTAAGTCAATVAYTTPAASDNCQGATVVCSPASGTSFAKGVTTVTCTATDAANLTGTCTFTVTVNDNQAPTVVCPANITTNTAAGTCAATVAYTTPAASDNCQGATVVCSPASGTSFAKGVTTVTCTATDAANLTGTCTFTVTVADNQNPTITCPANQTAGSTGGAVNVNYPAPTANDNCSGVTTNCLPASGSSFPVGTTTVTCTATDGANLTATCSFTVTVSVTQFTPTPTVSLTDPLACSGPGNLVSGTFSVTNTSLVPQSGTITVALPVGLVGLPNSCTTNVGSCTFLPTSVVWLGTLTPGQTITASYQAQIGDQVVSGTQLCAVTTANFGANTASVQACLTINCPAVGPGSLFPSGSEVSDQKAGSVLIYNIYTSGATSGNTQNTRINITNAHPVLSSFVHLFFVAEGCAVADSYICLTGNQTASFLASDLDPGTTGYIVAIAVDAIGCPTNFNYLIGDEYVKFTSRHEANLGAEAFAAIAGGLPFCNANSVTAVLNFDGVSYNRVPAVLALSSVGSRADGNDTLLIINRIGGNLGIGASTLGTVFGILYDDAENALSFSLSGNCQLRNSLSNNFPRSTPRFETFIPAGRTGWLKLFNQTGAIGITGAAINSNVNVASSAGAFNQGHNLHKLTLTTASYVIPLFPPSC